jgi:hypothetical protein
MIIIIPEFQYDYIRENINNKTNQELADDLGITKNQVMKRIQNMGITRRSYFDFDNNTDEIKSLKKLGFSNYSITSGGIVFNNETLIIIKHGFTPDGYCNIKMYNDIGKRETKILSRLVAIMFIPNDDPVNKIEVNHKNGNKLKNDVSNLEWVTPSDNQKHAYLHNLRTSKKGEESHLSRYTEKQIRTICKCLEKKMTIKEIYNKYDWINSTSIISQLKNRTRWNHVTKDYNY